MRGRAPRARARACALPTAWLARVPRSPPVPYSPPFPYSPSIPVCLHQMRSVSPSSTSMLIDRATAVRGRLRRCRSAAAVFCHTRGGCGRVVQLDLDSRRLSRRPWRVLAQLGCGKKAAATSGIMLAATESSSAVFSSARRSRRSGVHRGGGRRSSSSSSILVLVLLLLCFTHEELQHPLRRFAYVDISPSRSARSSPRRARADKRRELFRWVSSGHADLSTCSP